jgi:hypothetical protein
MNRNKDRRFLAALSGVSKVSMEAMGVVLMLMISQEPGVYRF